MPQCILSEHISSHSMPVIARAAGYLWHIIGRELPVSQISRIGVRRCLWILVAFGLVGPAIAQSSGPSVAPSEANSATSGTQVDTNLYAIGPGDVLSITFSNSPELNQKVQVSQAGEISVPLLPAPIHAAGLTPLQLSEKVAKALEDAKQLRRPYVNIYVEGHNSHYATVLGAVARPGVYPLVRPTSLIELISTAGGLTTVAGATLTVTHATDEKGVAKPAQKVQLSELRDNRDPSQNVAIRSGDVVNVSSAPVIYVVGAVRKPGVVIRQDAQSGITLLQILAEAQGLQPTAAASRSLVIRHPEGSKQRQLIRVDLGRLMKGHVDDQELQPNDILFVPESQTKKTLEAMARTAEATASQIAGYGLGIRVAGVR